MGKGRQGFFFLSAKIIYIYEYKPSTRGTMITEESSGMVPKTNYITVSEGTKLEDR